MVLLQGRYTSVLAFLCLFSLLFLFLLFPLSLSLLSVFGHFLSVFFCIIYLWFSLSMWLLSVRPGFSGFVFGWLNQQPTVRGSWSSFLLEESHKSLCLINVSVFLPPCLFVSVCCGLYRARECPITGLLVS
jgi:hypothetical protein